MSTFSGVVASLRRVARLFRPDRPRLRRAPSVGWSRGPEIPGLRHPRLEPLEERALLGIGDEIRRAVLIGVSGYQTLDPLASAAADAQAFRGQLLTDSRWQPGNVTLLTDAQASKAAIQSAIANLAAAARPGDVSVVFYAGHGGLGPDFAPLDEPLDNQDAYVAAFDSTTTGGLPDATWIRDDELRQWLAAFDPNAQVNVFLDADHSGGMIEDFSANLLNVVAIASCGKSETRREDSGLGHSFFANYLLEGMASKLTDADPAPPYHATGGPGSPGFTVNLYKAVSSTAPWDLNRRKT